MGTAKQPDGYLGICLKDDEDKKPRGPGGGGGPGGGVGGGTAGGTGATAPRDPLVLDLDGDGIELTAVANSVLFDHNADGVRTGTQWVKADDGMLVRDLNGNGTIDSGRELFGDQTQMGNAQTATEGFSALRPLDSNGDGQITSADAAFGELRIWQDTNQDGISQANELRTLNEVGITRIGLNATATAASGGQLQTDFDRTTVDANGISQTSTQTIRNINFRQDTFVSEFIDKPTVSDEIKALPQMFGSGMVRDMHSAMSLGTAASTRLQGLLRQFETASNASERQALIDTVIQAWGDTSSFRPAIERRPYTPPKYDPDRRWTCVGYT